MTWFQNPFVSDFTGNWVLGDRQHSPTFECHRNQGRGDENVVSWNTTNSLDFTGNDVDGESKDTLLIAFSFDYPNDYKQWQTLSVTGDAGSLLLNATNTTEVVSALNSQTTFSDWFVATEVVDNARTVIPRVMIRQLKAVDKFRFCIVNGRAETVLRFNAKATVAELPTYFSRHIVGNVSFPDCTNILVALDPDSSDVDAAVIDSAVDIYGNSMGYNSSITQDDWELLRGKSGLFTFRHVIATVTIGYDEYPSIVVEYPAGARVGDLGKRITYTYIGATTNVDHYTEEPHTIEAGDLITPI